jgi:hypothetical protein
VTPNAQNRGDYARGTGGAEPGQNRAWRQVRGPPRGAKGRVILPTLGAAHSILSTIKWTATGFPSADKFVARPSCTVSKPCIPSAR